MCLGITTNDSAMTRGYDDIKNPKEMSHKNLIVAEKHTVVHPLKTKITIIYNGNTTQGEKMKKRRLGIIFYEKLNKTRKVKETVNPSSMRDCV